MRTFFTIKDLTERDKEVLYLRRDEGLTRAETARHLHVTPERIRQIEHKAQAIMRWYSRPLPSKSEVKIDTSLIDSL